MDGGQPPAPPPRTSSATSGTSADSGAPGSVGAGAAELGKGAAGGGAGTCMQCYLSGHSDGSLDSVDPSTEADGEASSEAEPIEAKDRDSGIMDSERFDRFDSAMVASDSPPSEAAGAIGDTIAIVNSEQSERIKN